MMIMNHHPLEGAAELKIHCFDEVAQKSLYGKHPVFVFDPDDDSNRPVPGEHDTVIATWRATPTVLHDLFRTAFTRGLRDPGARVRESQWRTTLSRVRDTIVYCHSCGRQNYHDEIEFNKTGYSGTCWRCHKPIILPPRILLNNRAVMLNRDAVLCEHHLNDNARQDPTAIVAAVTPHPARPGTFGLTNRSSDSWMTVWPDGTTKVVGPNQTVPLRNRLRLQIRGVRAEIRSSA
jgi:hypothetical protein